MQMNWLQIEILCRSAGRQSPDAWSGLRPPSLQALRQVHLSLEPWLKSLLCLASRKGTKFELIVQLLLLLQIHLEIQLQLTATMTKC